MEPCRCGGMCRGSIGEPHACAHALVEEGSTARGKALPGEGGEDEMVSALLRDYFTRERLQRLKGGLQFGPDLSKEEAKKAMEA